MTSTSGSTPTPSQLSGSLLHRLNLYAVAATAAGVASAASTPSAEAKIVYTPANIPIIVNGGFVELDLNHDGINDFQFNNVYGNQNSTLNVAAAQKPNRAWAVSCTADGPLYCAAALPNGTKVGPHNFQAGHTNLGMAFYHGGSVPSAFGRWLEVKQAYLGLRFVIKGKTHFGRARIRMGGHSKPGFAATITGYAYETVPNKPIITGKTKGSEKDGGSEKLSPTSIAAPTREPARLGLLALGSLGLSIWLRE
jgi:hypothetical protein